MSRDDVAGAVLAALGGRANVLTNTVCMTRLRVTLSDPQAVDYDQLNEVQGVLGTATRGNNGLEVVFGPRMIDGIYHAFIRLTGIAAGTDALFPMSRQSSNMRVQISPARTGGTQALPDASRTSEPPLMDAHEMSVLEDLFGRLDEGEGEAEQGVESPAESPTAPRLLVLNGPNINMMGAADGADFAALLQLCKDTAAEQGFSRCDCVQSNHEGDLVDALQDTFGTYGGIVINPSSYGTSRTLRETLETIGVPAVEVHFRKRSKRDAVGMACMRAISGHGTDGYREAIVELAERLGTGRGR